LPNDRQSNKELKVTDKRIFTSEGELRDEFRDQIHPSDPAAFTPAAPPAAEPAPAQEPPPASPASPAAEPPAGQRDQKEKGENPGTPFTMFLETLIVQAYMSLGMIKDPYNPGGRTNPAAARQMIDILALLQEKTAGNLQPEEYDFLTTHLGELKLAYVQRTKSI
jgi:hypothetical protein